MKVILLQDVRKIGKKNEVKEVPDGYARNFLIARKLAKVATGDSLQKLKKELGNKETKKAIQHDLLAKNVGELRAKSLVIQAQANPKGGLFMAIKPRDVVKEIKKQFGFEIEEKIVSLSGEQIKEVGESELSISIDGKVEKVLLEVVSK